MILAARRAEERDARRPHLQDAYEDDKCPSVCLLHLCLVESRATAGSILRLAPCSRKSAVQNEPPAKEHRRRRTL